MIAVLDACVLYPAPVRDLLLSIAEQGLFSPRWSDEIHNEWIRNLLKNRADLNERQLIKAKLAMNMAFPESNFAVSKSSMYEFDLPDANDKHVLACAIESNSETIVTFNLRDFPESQLKPFRLQCTHPDEFLMGLARMNSDKVLMAFLTQVERLKHPPMTTIQVLKVLVKCGLPQISEYLKNTL